jgi:hypothetical protein
LRAVPDGGEALPRVVDDQVVIDQLLPFLGQGHGAKHGGTAAACKPGGRRLNRGMVNPFWLWRGLKGNSVTFAALFASVLLGASISGGFKQLLASLGVHWLYVLLIPIFLFSWLSKKEPRWLPDEAKRKFYARGLIAGSIIIAMLIAWLRPSR